MKIRLETEHVMLASPGAPDGCGYRILFIDGEPVHVDATPDEMAEEPEVWRAMLDGCCRLLNAEECRLYKAFNAPKRRERESGFTPPPPPAMGH